MKRSRKNKSANKVRLSKRVSAHSADQSVPSSTPSLVTFAEGLVDGFAAPFIFLLGSDLSLAKRPVSGVAEAWQDVGHYIRESALTYAEQCGSGNQSGRARH